MNEEFSYQLKIPNERVGVLIGKEGEVKKEIEKETKTRMKIDSEEGEVLISGSEALKLYDAREIVRAIGRGFNPKIARLLLKTDYVLEVVDMREYAGKSKGTLVRLKGRVIGREGKSKGEIEQLTETSISVYGKTVAIIGEVEGVAMARRAVGDLLKGATHKSVYRFLERKRRKMRFKGLET